MTEDDLNKLSINELFDLMVIKTQDLIAFNNIKNEIEHESKKEELKLIQRTIVARRADFPPLV